MKIKISQNLFCILIISLFSSPLSARITVVNYTCLGDKPLTVSYFWGNATKNATTVFDNTPHKMYFDPTSTHKFIVFREEPYSLHVENKDTISDAVIINITKESQGEKLHDSTLYKHCVPQ